MRVSEGAIWFALSGSCKTTDRLAWVPSELFSIVASRLSASRLSSQARFLRLRTSFKNPLSDLEPRGGSILTVVYTTPPIV